MNERVSGSDATAWKTAATAGDRHSSTRPIDHPTDTQTPADATSALRNELNELKRSIGGEIAAIQAIQPADGSAIQPQTQTRVRGLQRPSREAGIVCSTAKPQPDRTSIASARVRVAPRALDTRSGAERRGCGRKQTSGGPLRLLCIRESRQTRRRPPEQRTRRPQALPNHTARAPPTPWRPRPRARS